MSALCAVVLLSVLSQTFAIDLLQGGPSRTLLNILQNRAPSPSYGPNNNGGALELTDLNSPILSEFAAYNLQVQKAAGIFPRLFDVSFSSDVIRENFKNEIIYFALENGLYEVGTLPDQVASAATRAFPHLTPLEFFKVTSNTFELALEYGGISTQGNYQVLARLNAKALEDAMDSIKVDSAQSALHAIIVGAGAFFKSLSLDSPDTIRYIIETYGDQFSKVPLSGGIQ